MRKVSIPLNKVSPQDINLAKSSKAMTDVEAILKLPPEERKIRFTELSKKISQGLATLYEEKVLVRLLSPGQAEWIKLIQLNLSNIEAKLTNRVEKEKSSLSEHERNSFAFRAEDPPNQTIETLLLNWTSEKQQQSTRSLSPESGISAYFKGFLMGVMVLSAAGIAIWNAFDHSETSRSEIIKTPQQVNSSSIPSDTLQVAQTQLNKGQQEIRVGDFSKGEFELREVISKYPETPQAQEAHLIIAEAYRHRNQMPDRSLQLYQTFLEKYPNGPQTGLVLLKMGFCYEDMEEKGNAIAMYKLVLQRNGEKSRIGQLAMERLKALRAVGSGQ